MSWKSITMCGLLGGTAGVMDGKELGLTRTTRGRLTQTRHEYSNVFVKRRGAWASPNQPLVASRTNTQEESLHTDTQGKGLLTQTEDKISNDFVKGEVHGQARTLPCYKTQKHTSKVYTRETQFWTPLWKERCMGKPECSLVTRRTNTHERQVRFECLCERWGARASPKHSFVTRHSNTQARFTHERHNFECLCERRGARASSNAPLPQDAWTHKQCYKSYVRKLCIQQNNEQKV